MANFQTHITTSTVLGVGYAGVGMMCDVPIDACLVAGGLCGIGGMLPDMDSDSGIPVRELMTFVAASVPLLMIDWFQMLALPHNSVVLVGGALYFFVRFILFGLFKKYTVHRGMFHSIPAAILFAEIVFLICGCQDLQMRYFKAGGVLLGVMSHLVLDEIYSIEMKRGRVRLKKSFGTAIKFWGNSLWGNVSVYAKLILVTGLILSEPMVMEHLGTPAHARVHETVKELVDENKLDDVIRTATDVIDGVRK